MVKEIANDGKAESDNEMRSLKIVAKRKRAKKMRSDGGGV